ALFPSVNQGEVESPGLRRSETHTAPPLRRHGRSRVRVPALATESRTVSARPVCDEPNPPSRDTFEGPAWRRLPLQPSPRARIFRGGKSPRPQRGCATQTGASGPPTRASSFAPRTSPETPRPQPPEPRPPPGPQDPSATRSRIPAAVACPTSTS